jgi:predicted site-specific integrase-resolvase
MFEYFAKVNNFNIIIIDNSETNKTKEQEFCDDIISIIHYFSMKLYGQRSYKKKIEKAENNLKEIKNEIIKI